jgi:hypothetical protein
MSSNIAYDRTANVYTIEDDNGELTLAVGHTHALKLLKAEPFKLTEVQARLAVTNAFAAIGAPCSLATARKMAQIKKSAKISEEFKDRIIMLAQRIRGGDYEAALQQVLYQVGLQLGTPEDQEEKTFKEEAAGYAENALQSLENLSDMLEAYGGLETLSGDKKAMFLDQEVEDLLSGAMLDVATILENYKPDAEDKKDLQDAYQSMKKVWNRHQSRG